MSETNPTPDATTSTSTSTDGQGRCAGRGGHRRGRFGRKIAVLAILFAGLAGLGAAFAGGGHCAHRGGPVTAEGVREHMAWATDRALDRVDATDEQYKAVDGIIDESAPQLAAFAQQGHELKGRFHSALSSDPTDRAALEALRAEGLALADKASAAALDDLVKLASVLTPEQRQELASAWEDHKK